MTGCHEFGTSGASGMSCKWERCGRDTGGRRRHGNGVGVSPIALGLSDGVELVHEGRVGLVASDFMDGADL